MEEWINSNKTVGKTMDTFSLDEQISIQKEIEESFETEGTETAPITEIAIISTLKETTKNISKYAAKKLQKLSDRDAARNYNKIKNNKAVPMGDKQIHKKVSRNLLLSLRNECATVVCEETGIVAVLNIPSIPGKVLTWRSPLASLPNARGIVQEGEEYLNKLDSQILAGLFLTLTEEYDLLRYTPSATGAENNAILRTASKEKLIQALILVERYIHSNNHIYQPKLSIVYDEELRNNGVESRVTEWMRLVNETVEKPDLSTYDENALLQKPMRSISDLKKEYTKIKQEEKRVANLKDKNFKERAAFRKDMKEAKNLISNMKDSISAKMTSFLKQLFTEESYLTVDKLLLGQLSAKLEAVDHASAKRLIEIIGINRDALRKETMIDDLDDPLMSVVSKEEEKKEEPKTEGTLARTDISPEQKFIEGANNHNEELKAYEGEFTSPIASVEEQQKKMETLEMPKGLSFAEKILWKRKNGVK